jgi:hypothetical protein
MVAGFGKLASTLRAIAKTSKSIALTQALTTALANPARALAGLAIGGAVVGGVASLISKSTKEDDMVSPGYGKRVLSMPEGSIALNDKDTIVAGTNLTQNSIINNTSPSTQTTSTVNTTTQMMADNSSELKAIKNVLEKIATNEGSININGTKFGTVTAMNTYQIQ